MIESVISISEEYMRYTHIQYRTYIFCKIILENIILLVLETLIIKLSFSPLLPYFLIVLNYLQKNMDFNV